MPQLAFTIANVPTGITLFDTVPTDWDNTKVYKPVLYSYASGAYGQPAFTIPIVSYNTVLYILKDFTIPSTVGVNPATDTTAWEVYAITTGGGTGLSNVTSNDGSLFVTTPVANTRNISSVAFATKAVSYQLIATDRIIKVTATGTTQTLPNATLITAGIVLTIELATGLATCTLNTLLTQTINGQATYTLSGGESVSVTSDGTNYIVLSNYAISTTSSPATASATYATAISSQQESTPITLTWSTAFANTNYALSYSAVDSNNNYILLRQVAKTTTTIQLIAFNFGNNSTGTLTIKAIAF